MPTFRQNQRQRWEELTSLLDRVDRKGWPDLSAAEVKQLCRLYRQATIDLSQARTAGDDPELIRYLNALAARAHGRVYQTRPLNLGSLVAFLSGGFPRLVRRRLRFVLVSAGVFLLTALASGLAVVRDPELAYSLWDENYVEYENIRLERQEGEYKGNFTFAVGESPLVAVVIIGNNIKVAILAFALGALGCLPAILLLIMNGRMLGTLSGLMVNHGYFLAFYSLILTHGVLELSAICIAGAGGLMLGWALIAPGQLSRRDALRQAAGEAFGLLAGAAALLVIAGLIEAHVTPHFPAVVRWSVAGATAVLLAAYLAFAGRGEESPAPLSPERFGEL
jgi:uncharacterized membrane protein SpoIIM required for sporulation